MPADGPARKLVADVQAAIAAHEQLGFRLDMIMPADEPRLALMSRDGESLRLEREGARIEAVSRAPLQFQIAPAARGNWSSGRAGMAYRDLIPGRLGGRVIASLIRIAHAGPVPDYVHRHAVRFQMIYCRRGWVRVVYEDQGPAFVMHEGDCVLQPPGIRHRVLESSNGLEVVEVVTPAEHETFRDHDLGLPTPSLRPERVFAGQRFVRHVAKAARWRRDGSFEVRDLGLAGATSNHGDARVLRSATGALQIEAAEPHFLFVLDGRLRLTSTSFGDHALDRGDACVIPAGEECAVEAGEGYELLDVTLPL
jgi:quercetin dioxygenase-like cupin family protein